jgi:hypothetical protein
MSSLYFEKKKSFPFKRNELLVEQYFVTSQLWSSVTYHTISIISLLFVANTISSHTPSQYPPIPHHNILHTPSQYHLPIVCKLVLVVNVAEILII